MALEKEFPGVATYVIKSSGKNVEELSTQQAVAMKDFIATSEETQIMMLEHAVSQRHITFIEPHFVKEWELI